MCNERVICTLLYLIAVVLSLIILRFFSGTRASIVGASVANSSPSGFSMSNSAASRMAGYDSNNGNDFVSGKHSAAAAIVNDSLESLSAMEKTIGDQQQQQQSVRFRFLTNGRGFSNIYL